ncbi:MAG: class II aldolase/adducin family protein [Oscillospiraceae bacterium]|nr:class II aldolase/adducin family protein [Oscillospiraceae bacterium]
MNEQALKKQICEISRKMWTLGWVASNDGNISVKMGEEDYLVTAAGVSMGDITEDDVIRVVGAYKTNATVKRKPSSEFNMHVRCYMEREEDVNAVIHAHPPGATAFAVAGKPLDDYSLMEAVLTIGCVPVTPYATPSTPAVGDSIAPFLKEHDVLLLKNHGALTVGADLQTAYSRMETLELWAKTILNAAALGWVCEIPKAEIEKLSAMRGQYGITGRHPGYKKFK